jgi:hypothetical protein
LNEFRKKAHHADHANARSSAACRPHEECIVRGIRLDEFEVWCKLRMRTTGLKSELDFALSVATAKCERLLCPPRCRRGYHGAAGSSTGSLV